MVFGNWFEGDAAKWLSPAEGVVVKMPTKAFARVMVTLEFTLSQPWGDAATVAEIRKRGAEEALERVMAGFVINGLTCKTNSKTEARVVGDPKVTAILVEDDR